MADGQTLTGDRLHEGDADRLWSNEHKRSAAILNRQTFCLDADNDDHGIKHVELEPSLDATNMFTIKIGKDFTLDHGYIEDERLRDVVI